MFGNNVGADELRPVFNEAMANGLNLWDSAVVYGMGASESILSTFTKERKRGDVLISTKFTPQIADEAAADPVTDMCEGSLSASARITLTCTGYTTRPTWSVGRLTSYPW